MNFRVCVLAFTVASVGLTAGAQESRPTGQEKVAFEKAAFPFEGEITCDRLNFRLLPKADAAGIVAGVLAQGAKVTVVGDQGDYFRILPPKGCHVWISARNVKRDSETEGSVLVNDAPVRLDSRQNADRLAGLAEGTKVTILKEHLGWYQITPPDAVGVFVSRKYVKNIGPASVEMPKAAGATSLAGASKADDEALAVMRSAETAVDEQHKLINAQQLDAVNFDKVVELYSLAQQIATSEEIKKTAEANVRRYRDFGATVAMTRMRLKEIADIKEQNRRRDEGPVFDFTGYVDTVGPLWNRPGTHKLMMAGRIICFLKVKEGDEATRLKLNGFFQGYVGVRGTVTRDPEGWKGYSVVEVEAVEEVIKK